NNPLGLLINKGVTLQGVDQTGLAIVDAAAITDPADVVTIVSAGESGWGTHFFVTADNVTITGLSLVAQALNRNGQPITVVNKVVEIVADNFTLNGSMVGAD